jgi:DNA-binding XRE family transcriptional regulator
MVAVQKTSQPALRLVDLRRDIDISQEKMARLFDVSSKTIARWEAQDALPNKRYAQHLWVKLQEVRELGLIVYGPEGFHLFMTTPMPVFDNRTALDLIEHGRIDEVISALAADYEGQGF